MAAEESAGSEGEGQRVGPSLLRKRLVWHREVMPFSKETVSTPRRAHREMHGEALVQTQPSDNPCRFLFQAGAAHEREEGGHSDPVVVRQHARDGHYDPAPSIRGGQSVHFCRSPSGVL